MAVLVTSGAQCVCSFGSAPCTLNAVPSHGVVATNPAATIDDYKPGVNLATFGSCQTTSNPAVASATSAAMGVLTPQPCTPATAAPWAPGSPTVLIGGKPALNNASTCTCSYGGTITITSPGQAQTMVP